MDIDRVRYFHAFAELGSLVKASEVLNISQPALSKALKLLEEEVGSRLLEPDGRGLRLTSSGEIFKTETWHLLEAWRNIPERLKASAVQDGIRIGSFEVFTTYFLSHLLKYLPLDNLELHEYAPGKLEDAIASGAVDVGITYVPIPKAGVEFIEAAKIKMGVFGLSKFLGAEYDALPFVIPLQPAQGTPSKVIGLDGWPDHRFRRNVRFRVTMMESALELARRGEAVVYLPEFIASLHNRYTKPEFALKELKSPIPQRDRQQGVFVLQRQGSAESKLLRVIARSLREL